MDDLFKDVEEVRPDGEQPLHFYYNREERIAKASPQVQEYYRGGMRPVRGIKVLFIKQNRYIFLALVFFVAITWLYTGLNRTSNAATINGVNCELSAFSFGEEVYVSVSMKRSKKSDDTIPVNITADIFVINNDNQVSDKREIGHVYNKDEEFLRAKFTDYDIIRIDVILKSGDEKKEISAAVKQQ